MNRTLEMKVLVIKNTKFHGRVNTTEDGIMNWKKE